MDASQRHLLEVLDDLEQQADGLQLLERDDEVAGLADAEYAAVDLEARLRGSTGHDVTLRLRGGWQPAGELQRVGPTWALLATGPTRWLVATAALVTATGLGERAGHPATRSVADGLSLRSLLRRVRDDARGADVAAHLVDGQRCDGELLRVGADFVELRRGGGSTCVASGALAAVRWTPW